MSNPVIHINLNGYYLKQLRKGNTLQFPHDIDRNIFLGKLGTSNWPDLYHIHEEQGFPGYIYIESGVVLGSMVPSKFIQRIIDKFSDQEKYAEISYELSDKDMEIYENPSAECVHDKRIPNTFVMDRIKLDDRPISEKENAFVKSLYKSPLIKNFNSIPYPNPFVLNYFRSAKPIADILENQEDFDRFDVVISCGEIDPKRIVDVRFI